MSILRLRSVASIAMQIFAAPRTPRKATVHCDKITKKKQAASAKLYRRENNHFSNHRSESRENFNIFQSGCSSLCSINEPRGVTGKTTAHWLCLVASHAVIG